MVTLQRVDLFTVGYCSSQEFFIHIEMTPIPVKGIFASQVSNPLTLINPLDDLARGYRTCPEIPGHPIKLQFVNNMKTILLKRFS